MGNMMDIDTTDGDKETAREIVTELQKQTSVVDQSLTGLAKSIDSMQAACKMLRLPQEKTPEDDAHDACLVKRDEERKVSGSYLAFDLLRCIEESVTDHKFIAMEGVCKLLHLIARTLQKFRVSTCGSDVELSLDKYLSAKNPFDNKRMYYDEKVKNLYLEIDMLKDIKRSLRSRIDIQNKKELSLTNEKENLRKQLSQLEKNVNRMSEESQTKHENQGDGKDEQSTDANKMHLNDDSENKTKKLDVTLEDDSKGKVGKVADIKTHSESEKSTVTEEIIKLKEGKKSTANSSGSLSNEQERTRNKTALTSVHLQIYRQHPRSQIDNRFFDMLKSKAETKALKLSTIRRATQQEIKTDKPLLVLCVAGTGASLQKVVGDAIKGIDVSLKVGVVIFHTDNTKSVQSKKTFPLKSYHPYSSFGGIFDIACSSNSSIINCDDNYNCIGGIIDFLCKRG